MEEKKKRALVLTLILTLILLCVTAIGVYFVWQGTNDLVTEKALATCQLIEKLNAASQCNVSESKSLMFVSL